MIAILFKYWQLALLVAVIIAGWAYLEHAKAVQYELGTQAGQTQLLAEQEKRLKDAFDAERALIERDRTAANDAIEAARIERNALKAQQNAIKQELRAGLSALYANERDIRNENATITDSITNSSYRDAMLRARTAESNRTTP